MSMLWKFSVCREPLNAQGYTSGGRYFGVGAPLYRYSGEVLITPPDAEPYTDLHEGWTRGTRDEVKAFVKACFPAARFYR